MAAAGDDESDRVAVRRCLSPACRTCGTFAAVHIIRYPPGGGHGATGPHPFPSGADPAACRAALLDLECRLPRGRIQYELCAAGVGLIRADRAGWLARLRSPGEPGGPDRRLTR